MDLFGDSAAAFLIWTALFTALCRGWWYLEGGSFAAGLEYVGEAAFQVAEEEAAQDEDSGGVCR